MKSILSEPCVQWEHGEARYQAAAHRSIELDGRVVPQYAWILPKCGNSLCIESTHLEIQTAVRLAYPSGVCIYCGRSGWTKDHMYPRDWTGDARRRFTVTVPACGTCNSLIGDTLTWSITERRAVCKLRMRRKFAKHLRIRDWTAEEIEEFEGRLRDEVIRGLEAKKTIMAMLAFPSDPHYDLRALQKSGIENPYLMGILLEDRDIDRERIQAIANVPSLYSRLDDDGITSV